MKNRTITHLLYAHKIDMGGLPVRQPFPTSNVEQIDPFLLLHHADIKVPTLVDPRHAGVGPHPHRGFSPVTFIFKGGVHHRDSRGNDSVVYEGGAQWMNAGRGLIHSERPPDDIHQRGGRQEIIQLWLNSPSGAKMDEPTYQPVLANQVGRVVSDDGRVSLQIFAGKFFDVAGPIAGRDDVQAATLYFEKDGQISIPLPPGHNAFLYLLDGKLNIDGYGPVEGLHTVVFARNGEGITLHALGNTRALLVSGAPLNEKVVAHGPFVMNSETQILEAMRDFQIGKMGVLIEE
ncbi:MAG TPA: pirin family protein [Chryseosolibacter sp.]|nr:pirin family protein [Chryseosolibacter sp.]